MTLEGARQLAIQFLDENIYRRKGELVIQDELTIERPNLWIFFYQHKRWVLDGDEDHRLEGNLPILIRKQTGIASFLPGGWSTEDQIKRLCSD